MWKQSCTHLGRRAPYPISPGITSSSPNRGSISIFKKRPRGLAKHVTRWADEIAARPAVQRGRMVNRPFGPPESQLHERHDARDFDTNTEDKNGGKQ